jgi:hypothetical protein
VHSFWLFDPMAKQRLEEIELMRGGGVVSTLTGAFSSSLRETRLTAMLGYLIALYPTPFIQLFGFRGAAQRVSLETRHEEGRSDILIETNRGRGVIEAKIDASDPLVQSQRYKANWTALLTHRVAQKARIGTTRYVNWKDLSALLDTLTKSRSAELRLLSSDLLEYLRAHHMTRERNSVEIYAREINEPVTLELFLHARLYGCLYEASSRLPEALYFAPHFGARITEQHPGVNIGISYVAKIESIGNATTWQEFRELAKFERGASWWKRHRGILDDLHRTWEWNTGKHRSYLFLGSPRLVFNPPVRKENLQKGRGWLSRRTFAFDELFAAWGKIK